MDAHDEHIFVVRTVPNPDDASGRNVLMGAPEKVMVKLGGRGRFETCDIDA